MPRKQIKERLDDLFKDIQKGETPQGNGVEQANPAPSPIVEPVDAGLEQSNAIPAEPVAANPKRGFDKPEENLVKTPTGRLSISSIKPIVETIQSEDGNLKLIAPFTIRQTESGTIEIVNDKGKEEWRDDDKQLVSEIANQLGLAIENAQLYQKVQDELTERTRVQQAIIRRDNALTAIARAVAILTDLGTRALSTVLKSLGEAIDCSRIYFSQIREDESGAYWRETHEWINPKEKVGFDRAKLQRIPVRTLSKWAESLHEKSWVTSDLKIASGSEKEYLTNNALNSILWIAVSGKSTSTPSYIAFESTDPERIWELEEISALQISADALSNTFTREGLLEQIQVSLDETENLYNASHRLATATDMTEMLAAIAFALNIPSINREILVLFDRDPFDKIISIKVAANWYSGRGTPPLKIGDEYPNPIYENFFTRQEPEFFDELVDPQIPEKIQEELAKQHVGAMAILPLRTGKRQIGILLMFCEDRHHFGSRELRTYPPLVDQMSTAVDNLRLFKQTQDSLAETGLLYKISTGVAQANSASDLVELVTENILPKTASRVILATSSSFTTGNITRLEFVADENLKGGAKKTGTLLSIYDLPMLYNLSEEILMIKDIKTTDKIDEQSKLVLNKIGVSAVCFIPLWSAGRFIGLLLIASDEPVEFSSDEIRIMKAAANGISIALERQRLLREAQHRAFELQIAAEIARDTTSTLSLEQLLNRIVNQIRDRFNFYHTAVYLIDQTSSIALVQEATGDAGQEMKSNGFKVEVGSNSVIGSVTKSGDSVIINDVSASNIFIPNPLLPRTQSEIGLPLKSGERVIGAMDIQSDALNAFTQSEVAVLQILADQTTIAIENAKAYELSQKAVDELHEIDRIKNQFLANMSHELRTPLNSIIGFSRVILKGIDGPVTDTQSQDLTAIYNSGQHLLSLINNILDLSKIEAGKMELQYAKINIGDLISSALSTATGLIKDKPIKLEQKVSADLPLVNADQTRIRQVIINFVSNAIKFTESGSIVVEANTTLSPTGKPEMMVTVTDTGTGIEEKDRVKLFLPFSQVDDSPTRKAGGTGLGLSISRSIVEMHGGRIGLLSSEPGKGSKFFFTLPVEEALVKVLEKAPAGGGVILAIDDNPDILSLYERYLKPHGYDVYTLTNPEEALDVAKKIHPFAITVDIMMPQRDGWSVLKELKEDPDTREIPIIICSIVEEKEKGLKMGAADYLVNLSSKKIFSMQ